MTKQEARKYQRRYHLKNKDKARVYHKARQPQFKSSKLNKEATLPPKTTFTANDLQQNFGSAFERLADKILKGQYQIAQNKS